MKKFSLSALQVGDIIQTRSFHVFGRGIRAVIGSYTNHTGMVVRKFDRFYVGEAVAPRSRLTPLDDYEKQINSGETIVRVLRVKSATPEQRQAVSQYFIAQKIGLKYPLGVLRLWVMRFTNSLPWKVRGEWCTRIVWDSWHHVVPDVLMRPPDQDNPEGKRKKNPTPRTVENRLVAGVLVDVTDKCLIDS